MKSKKILIGIVVVVVLFIIGLIGKNNNEAKMVIKNAEIAINEGNYEKARELLYTVVDGNNKKIDKLWNIVNSYQNAQTANLEAGLKYLDEIDNSYKKYNKLKEDVDNLREELLFTKKVREEFKLKIDEVKGVIDKGNYKEAMELSEETSEWQHIEQKDKNTMYDLHVQAMELYSEQVKEERKEEQKKQDEEEKIKNEQEEQSKKENQENNFSKEVAQKIIDKLNNDNGNSRNFYEITSDLKTDDNGKKYFDVVAKDKDWIKFDDHTILANYKLYSNEELVEIQ